MKTKFSGIFVFEKGYRSLIIAPLAEVMSLLQYTYYIGTHRNLACTDDVSTRFSIDRDGVITINTSCPVLVEIEPKFDLVKISLATKEDLKDFPEINENALSEVNEWLKTSLSKVKKTESKEETEEK